MRFKNCLEIIEKNRCRTEPVLYFYQNFRLSRSLTYQDIWLESQKVALAILDRKIPTSQVLISVSNSPEYIFSYFGALMAGSVPVPIATRETLSKKEYLALVANAAERVKANLIITDQVSSSVLRSQSALARIEFPLRKQKDQGNFIKISGFLATDEACAIQFSSGVTCDPKPVVLSHENILTNLEQLVAGLQIGSRDTVVSALPFQQQIGWLGGVFLPLFSQSAGHLIPSADFSRDPVRFIEFVAQIGGSILLGTELFYNSLVTEVASDKVEKNDLSAVRLALIGGGPTNSDTCRRVTNHFFCGGFRPGAITPIYGLSESAMGVALNPVGRRFRSLNLHSKLLEQGQIIPCQTKGESTEFMSCGRPVPGIELRICSPDGLLLDEKSIGEVHVKSAANSIGYYSESLAERIGPPTDFLRTGDLGFLHEGELFIVGKIQESMQQLGKTFFAPDIERKVAAIKGFKWGRMTAFAVTSEFENLEVIHLAIELGGWRPGQHHRIKVAVGKALRGRFPISVDHVYLIPSGSLPLTTSGKIKRGALISLLRTGQLQKLEKSFLVNLLKKRFQWIFLASRMAIIQAKMNLHYRILQQPSRHAVASPVIAQDLPAMARTANEQLEIDF